MTEDHDLLIRLDTKLDLLAVQMNDMNKRFDERQTDLLNRVIMLENKDSRDSEKVQAITRDVQRSLDNHQRINVLEAELAILQKFKDREWQIWLIVIGSLIGTVWSVFFK